MRQDPAATLRRWTIDVDVGGVTCTIPPLPASAWLLGLVAESSYLAIIPGMLTDPTILDDLITNGRVAYADCQDAARHATAVAAGVRWWTAERLAHLTATTWIGAELLLRGLDPDAVSLGAYLAAAHRAASKALTEQNMAQLEHDLDIPPVGIPPEEWYDPQEAEQNFMAAMSRG